MASLAPPYPGTGGRFSALPPGAGEIYTSGTAPSSSCWRSFI